MPSAAFPGSKTRLSNILSTQRRVLYEVRAWAGRNVLIDRLVEWAGVPTAHCRLVGCEPGVPLEVPLWMFDQRACFQVRRAERPQVDLTALHRLRSLLDRAICGDGGEPVPLSTASDCQADALSRDRQQRADHAPFPPDACPVASVRSTGRQRPAQRAAMAEAAVPNASARNRSDDSVVLGTCPEPSRRHRGRHRRDASGQGGFSRDRGPGKSRSPCTCVARGRPRRRRRRLARRQEAAGPVLPRPRQTTVLDRSFHSGAKKSARGHWTY